MFKSRHFLILLICSAFTLVSACNKDCEKEPDLDVDQEQLAKDIRAIDTFLEDNGITAEKHPSGIRYILKREGDGARPVVCNNIYLTYEGKLLNDQRTIFDSKADPVGFNLGGLITGWQIGVPLIKENGRITLYIPSVYGYGTSGSESGNVPPNTNLEFEIVLFQVN